MFSFQTEQENRWAMRIGAGNLPNVWQSVLALCVLFFFGCAPLLREAPPTLSGTFNGTAADGRDVQLTLDQDENTVTGIGSLGGCPFSFSAITSFHGPVVINWADGRTSPGHATLSPNGATVTISGVGPPVTLDRGGEPLADSSGPFAGRFSASRPRLVWIDLSQWGDLLAGTGFDQGKPVAVVGKVIEPLHAKGTLLFGDESLIRVGATLSEDEGTLTVEGLGAPIHMKRR
jgi:hypothetical protein